MHPPLGHAHQKEEIATRAYNRWANRDSENPLDDWLIAEEEVRQLQELTQRVAQLEATLTTKNDLSQQLEETQSRLRQLLNERQRADRRLLAEHAVARFLAESADFGKTGPRILQAICEAQGWEQGIIWMLDRAADVLRQVEVWQTDAAVADAFKFINRNSVFTRGEGLPGRIWASRRPAWTPMVARDTNPLHLVSTEQTALCGGIGFPICDEDEFLGVIEFFSRQIQGPERELIDMMGRIGNQISQFIQRRRAETRLQREDEQRLLARDIQEGLLPNAAPCVPGFSIGARSWPCYDVGGDYFDTFLMNDGSLALVIADASGHAIGPALVIAETRAYIRAFAMMSNDLSEILTLTNQRLCEDLCLSHFVTLLFARLDPRTLSLDFAGAGHCPGFVLDTDGKVKATLVSQGMPLGVSVTAKYPRAKSISLIDGDMLFLYTDGISESGARGSCGLFGSEQMLKTLISHHQDAPDQIVDAIHHAATEFSPDSHRSDDMTAIVVKVTEGSAEL